MSTLRVRVASSNVLAASTPVAWLLLCVMLSAAAEPKKDAPPAEPDATARAEKTDDRKAEPKAEEKRPVPGPELKPGEVVRIVMDALKGNDEADRGIAITFDFASPANQAVTGPLERFIPMVKGSAYAPMLNHKSATYGKLLLREGRARQVVTIVDADGDEAAYLFVLSKQAEGDLKGCWMTDGVIRVEPGQEPGLDVPEDGNSERA